MKRKDELQQPNATGHKPVRYNLLRATHIATAAASILIAATACTNDPLAHNPQGDTPLPFTFTAEAPPAPTHANTRALGNNEWKGDGTEKIKVILEANGTSNKSTGTYTVISSTGKTAALPGDQLILWPSKDAAAKYTIYAWYPAREPGEEYNISDQSTPEKLRQADMLSTINQSVFYNTIPVLTFKRQMAKVRVVLTGVDASATDIEVGILSYPKFHLENYGGVGYVDMSFEDYIAACRDTKDANTVAFEAVLCPESGSFFINITKQNFIRITTGQRTYYFTPAADTPESLKKGDLYTYTVAIPSGPTPPTTPTATASASHITLPPGAVVTTARSRP